MKQLFKFLKNKTRSLDNYRLSTIKKSFKKRKNSYSMKNISISKLKSEYKNDIKPHKEKDEISILSNANLNIIKILDTCLKEDLCTNSSFLDKNKDNSKDNNLKEKKKIEHKIKIKGLGNKKRMSQITMKNKKYNLKINDLSNSDKNFNFLSSNQRSDPINSLSKCSSMKSNKKLLGSRKKIMNEKIYKNKYEKNYNNASVISKKIKNINSNISPKNVSLNENNYMNRLNNFNNPEFISYGQNQSLLNKNKLDNNNNFLGHLNEIEIMKINNNIHNDVNFIHLKNKISKLKRSFQLRYSVKNIEPNKIKYSKKTLNKEFADENIDEELNKKKIDNNYKSNKIKKTLNKKKENKIKILQSKNDKYRILVRKKYLYDSFDDEEGNDEGLDFYISPNSLWVKIFDIVIFLSSMFYFIFIPYFLSKNIFISKDIYSWKLILILIDALYISDVIINFFRAYHNFDENLIKRTNKIIIHYFKTWFFIDLIQAIPYFSLIKFFEKIIIMHNQNSMVRKFVIKYNIVNPLLYNLLMIKVIKVYKMFNYNSTISYISEMFARNEIIDSYGSILIILILIISCLNMCTCLFIFIGKISYPSWIIKLNIQDESHLNIFLTSLYFIIVTITTVGYGDITGETMPEIIFQVLLLIIGTIAYSFIISYISNYIVKINKKSMTFEKNLEILHEIKLHHPDMKNTLYNEILRNLYNEQLYEKKDKHLLFDCLPYSLKNKLIMEMYKLLINKFVFFKYINNADFIVKVITSLKPLLSFKDDIIIHEGDFVKEIIFVKRGVISLNICIDLDNPKDSIKKFFAKNTIGKFNISYINSEILRKKKTQMINYNSTLDSFFVNDIDDKQNNVDNYDGEHIEYIKIIEIRNNEHFGDALMFLNEPCPLVAKVKTKQAELLILRKIEAIEIYSIYPNIWKKINKKSLYNMEQIYLKIKKIILELSNRYNIKIEKKFLNKTNKKKKIIKKHKKNKKEEINKDNEHIKEINNNSNIKKTITVLTNNKSKIKSDNSEQKKSSKYSSDKNINNQLNDSQIMGENKTNNIINSNSESKSKKNSSESIYNRNDINEEIYNNESFIYNNRKLFRKLTFLSKENLNESIKYIDINDLNKSSFIKNNKELLSKNIDFFNLNITKENSFILNSSYDNINKISNNKYIKDMELQLKTKEFIINECTRTKTLIKKNMFLQLPGSSNQIPNINTNTSNSSDHRLSDHEISRNKRLKNNIKRFNTKKSINNKQNMISLLNNNDIKLENKKSLSTNKLTEIKKNLIKSNHINSKLKNTNIDSPYKIKRKKTPNKKIQKVNKKLNTITRNIQNTNESINNPNEFYMNFFNNIIQRSGYGEQEEDEGPKEKKEKAIKLLNLHQGNKNKDMNLSVRDLDKKSINDMIFFNSDMNNNKKNHQ